MWAGAAGHAKASIICADIDAAFESDPCSGCGEGVLWPFEDNRDIVVDPPEPSGGPELPVHGIALRSAGGSACGRKMHMQLRQGVLCDASLDGVCLMYMRPPRGVLRPFIINQQLRGYEMMAEWFLSFPSWRLLTLLTAEPAHNRKRFWCGHTTELPHFATRVSRLAHQGIMQ